MRKKEESIDWNPGESDFVLDYTTAYVFHLTKTLSPGEPETALSSEESP